MSGYFEIGILNGKTQMNVGTLWRSALQLGAAGIFVIGRRICKQASDTYNTADSIPLRRYDTFEEFLTSRPVGAQLVGVEMGGQSLQYFPHPHRCIYLLGAEDNGLTREALSACQSIVSIPSVRQQSYNVAVAGSLVMYDRVFRCGWGPSDQPD